MYIVSYKEIAYVTKAQVSVKLVVRKMPAIKGSIKLTKGEKAEKPKKKPAKKVKKAKKPATKRLKMKSAKK